MSEYLNVFQKSLQSILNQLKKDKNVISVFLMGSMSYDTVWEKSDIDLGVIVKNQSLKKHKLNILENMVPVHIDIYTQTEFRRILESCVDGSYLHALLYYSNVLYSTDDSFLEYFDSFKILGNRDMDLSLLQTTADTISLAVKSEKWLVSKQDKTYCQYYLLKLTEILGRLVVQLNNEIPNREAVLHAIKFEPDMIERYYTQLIDGHKTEEQLKELIDGVYTYLNTHVNRIGHLILRHLSDGLPHSLQDIAGTFNLHGEDAERICNLLCRAGLLNLSTVMSQLTPSSPLTMEESAYYCV